MDTPSYICSTPQHAHQSQPWCEDGLWVICVNTGSIRHIMYIYKCKYMYVHVYIHRQYRYPHPVGDKLVMGDAAWAGQGAYDKSLYLPLKFALSPKLSKKKPMKKKKKPYKLTKESIFFKIKVSKQTITENFKSQEYFHGLHRKYRQFLRNTTCRGKSCLTLFYSLETKPKEPK